MNDKINKVGNVYDYYKKKGTTEPVVMARGDVWDLDKTYTKSKKAIADWNKHYKKVENNPKLIKTVSLVPKEVITKRALEFVEGITAKPWLLRKLRKTENLRVSLTDHMVTASLSVGGVEFQGVSPYDVEMSSEVLDFCLRDFWGFNTTNVNARIKFNGDKGYARFREWEKIANAHNHLPELGFFQKIVQIFRRAS